MQFVPADEVHRLLTYPDLIEALRQSHRGPAPETSHVLRAEPDGGANRFISLLAWQRDDIIASKLVGVFPGNLGLTPPQPSVQGIVTVFDARTGAALLAADGAAMTFRKTAADSALAVDMLARQDAETLLVVGAGGLAPHVIAAHTTVRPGLRTVLIWNRTHARAEQLAAATSLPGIEVRAVDNLDAAVARADIISCVTMSTEPLVRGALLKPGTHLDLIGAYLPTMREADDDAMVNGSKFVDTRHGVERMGDLCQPVAAGLFGWDAIRADHYELCQGRVAGRTSPDEITVFKSLGGGHLDLFTARHLLSRLA